MLSYWAYILIGENNTGKTNFQKNVVFDLCGKKYKRMSRNLLSEITNPQMPRGVGTLFTMNRSYQEGISKYKSVSGFFNDYFQEADICILSSHSNGQAIDHIREMMFELKCRAYNVAAVFLSNGWNADAAHISSLDWNERLWLNNKETKGEFAIQNQIEGLSSEFSRVLISRAFFL